MSDTTTAGKPAVLRQDGPHRVTVAPGAHSALSPTVGPSGPRLRPAAGAGTSQGPGGSVVPLRPSANLRSRAADAGSSGTTVQRVAGRASSRGGTLPEGGVGRAASAAAVSALDVRLSALAELNSKTSKTVTAFEGDVGFQDEPTRLSGGPAPPEPQMAPRSLFKRRSS
jgi:hypothetical protein